MASPATVLYERREGVALLRLNRPQKHNAFNGEMSRALVALLDELEADEGVHVVVLTGSGKAFSAGADMTESLGALQGGGPGDGMARVIRRVAD
ncbi:MAG: enoyl-CoA hydratase/isomerase family protein, partial [Candidatus Bathyarchaeota archaeon]|nr:enoyl-CoA hydratase/isomerase family protein [Candidatus Bathyarchaeota archaeon]